MIEEFSWLTWAPIHRPVARDTVNPPTHIWHYPGGYRIGEKCKPVREAYHPSPREEYRGAHP